MRYWKTVYGGIIQALGTGNGGKEITEEEYTEIMSVIQSRPHAEGKGYKLREDLTWEEYPIDPPDPDPEIDDSELLDILIGGAE